MMPRHSFPPRTSAIGTSAKVDRSCLTLLTCRTALNLWCIPCSRLEAGNRSTSGRSRSTAVFDAAHARTIPLPIHALSIQLFLDIVFVAADFGALAALEYDGAALTVHTDVAVAVVIEFFFAEGVFVGGNK